MQTFEWKEHLWPTRKCCHHIMPDGLSSVLFTTSSFYKNIVLRDPITILMQIYECMTLRDSYGLRGLILWGFN